MKNNIIDIFKNKLVLRVTGRRIDSFINRLIKNNINILSMDYVGRDEINIKIYEKDYEDILKIKSIYDINIQGYNGLIKVRKIINYNKILIISILLGFFIIYSLSLFIFDIEVVHNSKELRELILRELNNNGITINKMKKSDKEIEIIKDKIKEKYENEIEWIEIISVGTKYIVRVEERKINNIDLDNTPRHIVSKKDAVIKKVVASNGEIIKNVDSYVKKGDIVVSGEIKLNDTIKNVVKAEAKVYGEVCYKVNITIPLTYYEEIYTNNKVNNYSFTFLNRNFKLKKGFKNKKENVEVILKNKLIPISFNKIVETEIKKVEKKFTIDEAINEGNKKSREKIEEKLKEEEYIINEIELKVNVKNSKIELEMFYTVYEDITDYKLIS